MGLPPYSGPFKVGALDLEIPVRKPRSFCNNVVEPGVLNKPAKKARRWAKKQNKEAKESRQQKQAEEQGSQKPSTSRNRPEARTGDSNGSTDTASTNHCTVIEATTAGEGDECCCAENNGSEDRNLPWSPWSTGSKTCTLHLETVLFTIYYPTLPMTDGEEKRYPRAAWLGRPVHAGVQALLQYIGQYGAFAIPASPAVMALIKARMPARVGPPLADLEELRKQAHPDRQGSDRAKAGNFGKRPPQFPVVIFSHGLAGNRLSYSQYCGELASRGVIVAAIEHRDGSGVSSIVRGEEAPSHAEKGREATGHTPRIIGRRSSGRMKASVPYFTFEQIGLHSFSSDPSEREVNLRRDQIDMRHAEIEETFYVLSEIQAGRGYEIVQRSTRNLGTKLAGHAASTTNQRLPANSLLRAERPLADWKGKLDLEFPTLCGHSFGGATVLKMMRRKETPFPMAMVLDPWVEPVGDPTKEEDQVKGRLAKPIYVLNSESFTVWEEHFAKLKRICLDARKTSGRGWWLTLTGSKHTDFSDYPFLLPRVFRSTVGPRHTIEVFSKATFMQMGLSRQRAREQENGAGYKVDRQGSLSDTRECNSSDAVAKAYSGKGQKEYAASPTKLVSEPEPNVTRRTPKADSQSGRGQRGNELVASETMVRSPAVASALEEGMRRHEAGDANVNDDTNAKGEEDGTATSPAFERPSGSDTTQDAGIGSHEESETKSGPPQPSTSDSSKCRALREECEGEDRAATGQEARDMVGERQRQTSTTSTQAQMVVGRAPDGKDFITDIRYLKMIDADQDVQQVHEALEGVAERFANKSKFNSRPSFAIRYTLGSWR